jgi:hypothetical protein
MIKIYVKNPDFVQREIAGEFILIPIKRNLAESNNLFVLNESGAAAWKLIDGKRTLQEICDQILTEYNTSQEQINQDLNTLFSDLLSIEAIHEKTRR